MASKLQKKNLKRPCWELPASVRPHLYMRVQKTHIEIYIYICIYIYILYNMLESYPLNNQKALRELGTVPPRELGTVPPLGGPLSHYKIRGAWGFGCKHVAPFWGSFFSDIQHPLFFESQFMRQFIKVFNKHYKIFFSCVLFEKNKITDR